MSKLIGRKVLKVQLHEGSHALGLGNVPTLVNEDLGGLKQSKLTLTEAGVLVSGKSQTGNRFEFILPHAACKLIQLDLDETDSKAK